MYEVLGSGAFGTVHRGVWSHSGGESDQVKEEEVAVKSMESGASEEERVKFLQEAAIMGQFNHPNIIQILGILEEEVYTSCNYTLIHILLVYGSSQV